MDLQEARRLAAAAPVARLGTVGHDARPHVVPVCFVLVGDTLYSAVDRKPKTTTRLQRLRNVSATGTASLLVDHYEADWTRLWWVRLDGPARVLDDTGDTDEKSRALAALTGKYPQYAAAPPSGPVLAVHVTSWSFWSAAG